ncbi:F510_1955 family glycosylhydrolase [Actinomycetospora lemnae]|uniref:Sialidase family protein n=1 Tax=Actinomycetospora lemnae TaxID=3019891 RepID=A0ABT5SVI8_9PSEU|nr:sialidase family protein [Actinomycetospora sp. DW7H6]MDD7966151.1 sialidase family protein [Actinomycetospora sp. DW7H6]
MVVTLLALAATLLAGCTAERQAPAGTASPVPAISHVHGLGIDPADGRLRIATHHGLFHLAGTGLEKVGASPTADRDLMGFLVVGPATYLASGHPSPDEVVTPDPLGLVRSTDGGQSWQTVGLDGEVDFHALDQGPDGIYGVDAAGGLRTSTDGRLWESLATPRALDVAADPVRRGRVALAVVGGTAVAEVDGRFAVRPGPQLVFLSWAPDGELYGLAPDARVFSSADGGSTWLARGSVPGGRPQALTAVGEGRVLAAAAAGIHESRDGGRTFTTVVDGVP